MVGVFLQKFILIGISIRYPFFLKKKKETNESKKYLSNYFYLN